MNSQEREMLQILQLGKEKFFFAGIKSEFEAEGTRMDEMIMLSQIVRKAGLNLGIKIGGCEAISDLYQAKLLGAEYIIAPMVETAYALSKYIEAKNKVYSEEERSDVRFLFNLETITAFNNLKEIFKTASVKNGADGIVFGRSDFIGSLGLSKDKIVGNNISGYINEVSQKCKENKLEFVIGGTVSKETISSVEEASKIYLSRFETRKIIFNAEAFSNKDKMEVCLENALKFELLWLENKKNYYSKISQEDLFRVEEINKRFKKQ